MMKGSNSWELKDIHHLGMTVADIEQSVVFYGDLLGMELIGRRACVDASYVASQTGYEGVQLSVASFRVNQNSKQSLEIVQYLNHVGKPSNTATNCAGNTHLCIVVDDLNAAYRDLQSRGVEFKSKPVPITAGPNQGGVVVYFFDPDGYVLEMFQPK